MRDCWSQVPIVEHFNCWLAGFHRDNQGLTAGACPNGRHLSLCSPNKNTKTFKSVINSFRPCSGVLTFKSLSTYNLEHWMHKWGLTFWATYSYTINFKTLPANITCNATRTNPDLLVECIGSMHNLFVDVCEYLFFRQGWDSLTGCLPSLLVTIAASTRYVQVLLHLQICLEKWNLCIETHQWARLYHCGRFTLSVVNEMSHYKHEIKPQAPELSNANNCWLGGSTIPVKMSSNRKCSNNMNKRYILQPAWNLGNIPQGIPKWRILDSTWFIHPSWAAPEV